MRLSTEAQLPVTRFFVLSLAGAALVTLAGCADRTDDTTSPSLSSEGAPAEVTEAVKKAPADNGHILLLKQLHPVTGAVVQRRAKFARTDESWSAGRDPSPGGVTLASQDQPADHPSPDVTVAPSGLRLQAIVARDSSFRGSFNTFCYYNGQFHQMTDFVVDSLKIRVTANTGGHIDGGHLGAKPKGRSTRTTGRSDALGEWPFTYYADSTAGDDQLLFYYTVYDTDEPAFCRGPKPAEPPFIFAKRYSQNLVRIDAQNGIAHGTITSQHFDIFYASGSTSAKTQEAARLYQLNYPSSLLRLTAATLIYGGLQDVNRNWRAPHIRHRIGTDVDLNAAPGGGGSERLRAIKAACNRAGFFSAIEESGRDHIHCFNFIY